MTASATITKPAATPDDRAALTAAVRAYSAAYFKPDPGTAGKLLSARCRKTTNTEAYAAALSGAVSTWGRQEIKSLTVDRLSGDMALVSYTYDAGALNQDGQPWVREGGAWHYDAC